MRLKVLILGVGSFAHSTMSILEQAGAEVGCYLTRNYGHYGPSQVGRIWNTIEHPSPLTVIEEFQPDLLIPMSIDWHGTSWGKEIRKNKIPILCPSDSAIKIESERNFASQLCQKFMVPFPKSFVVENLIEAEKLMQHEPRPYVLKNPLCSPFSPIQTIVCESIEDTFGWLGRMNYEEGLFLQEYLGNREVGHFAFVTNGTIYSLVTNQEYKRAFTGNLGPVAGAPMGGIVQQDPHDQYGIAKELIVPLLPWLKKTNFHGPLQVTAIQKQNTWYAIEYNVRLGVTSGTLFLQMLENSVETLVQVAQNQPIDLQWKPNAQFGASITLAGFGYPYTIPTVPQLPIQLKDPVTCDLWWNEVDHINDALYTAHHEDLEKGHRIADLTSVQNSLSESLSEIYDNIPKIHCLGSYYRQDIGKTLWPPGTGF